jgi:predicted nucleic acid-binding protein
MLVVDALALVAGPARVRLASDNLQAPELIDDELLSVLRRLGLRLHPSRSLWPRAWELRANLSATDALYVALAEQLDSPAAHRRCPPCQGTGAAVCRGTDLSTRARSDTGNRRMIAVFSILGHGHYPP